MTASRNSLVLAVLASLLLFSGSASAIPPLTAAMTLDGGVVYVSVVETVGDAARILTDAKVSIARRVGDVELASNMEWDGIRVGSNGFAVFRNVPPGEYVAIAEVPGYKEVRREFSKNAAAPAYVTVEFKGERSLCTDSDGGINVEEKGVVRYKDKVLTDKCVFKGEVNLDDKKILPRTQGPVLLEYYCSNDAPARKVYECLNGCLEGACSPQKKVVRIPSSFFLSVGESALLLKKNLVVKLVRVEHVGVVREDCKFSKRNCELINTSVAVVSVSPDLPGSCGSDALCAPPVERVFRIPLNTWIEGFGVRLTFKAETSRGAQFKAELARKGCGSDEDCPRIYCVTPPCPVSGCFKGACVTFTCGDGKCEVGEEEYCKLDCGLAFNLSSGGGATSEGNLSNTTPVPPTPIPANNSANINPPMCREDSDCPTIYCVKAPCPYYACVGNTCVLKEPVVRSAKVEIVVPEKREILRNHCFNGVRDYGERGIDCGGPCPPCPTTKTLNKNCFNGVKDGDEEAVDCGGSCGPCPKSVRESLRKDAEEARREVLRVKKAERAKSFGYKFLRALGLKKSQELEEVKRLEEQASKLRVTMAKLDEQASSVQNPEVKALLVEVREVLKDQVKELDALIEEKRAKAEGII